MDRDERTELEEMPPAFEDHAARLRGQARAEEDYPPMYETERMRDARTAVCAALRKAADAYAVYGEAVRHELRKAAR